MPRLRRHIPVNSALHIMCRGNNKQNIFNDDSDKLYYWGLLNELKDLNKLNVFHYCIMNNHIHLIVWIKQESNLSKFMKQLNLSYFNYYKRLYGYCGHIWQGRYKCNVIETGLNKFFNNSAVYEFNTLPQPAFNKNFDLLGDDLIDKNSNGYKIYILSENQQQIERSDEGADDNRHDLHPAHVYRRGIWDEF